MPFRFLPFLLLLVYGSTCAAPVFVNDSLSKEEEQRYIDSKISKTYFSKDRWKAAKDGISYEKDKEDKPPAPTNSSSPLSLEGLKYFIFGVVIIVLIALLTFFIMQLNLKKAQKPAVEIDALSDTNPEKEEDLLSLDLEPQIQDAIQSQQFSVATRLFYLLALQRLVKAKLLHWSKDQTNRHMLYLLHNKPFIPLLQNVFSQYESAWFGQKSIDTVGFQAFQSTLNDLLRQIEETKG